MGITYKPCWEKAIPRTTPAITVSEGCEISCGPCRICGSGFHIDDDGRIICGKCKKVLLIYKIKKGTNKLEGT